MGKKKKFIDDVALLERRSEGKTIKEISRELGVSRPTISRRISFLKNQEGILIKYRELQGLQLCELQLRLLEVVDSDKIEKASLLELLNAFRILQKAEIAIRGKDSFNFKKPGLLAHLQALEGHE